MAESNQADRCRDVTSNDSAGYTGRIGESETILRNKIDQGTFTSQDLIDLAKASKEVAALAKRFKVSLGVDDNEIADKIANEIIRDIENYVDDHLKKFNKFTLTTASQVSTIEIDHSTSKFFNLISLLKDVAILGRKLLEAAPQFESLRPSTALGSSDKKSSSSRKSVSGKSLSEEDATSNDLLAALIESSSSDDFLVLSSSLDSITTKDMVLASLILIKSHECFTLSHDIQGVVMVLRRTKFIILNVLAPKNQMELVIKLLTSIGRYNEMNYVFDLFRDRNQFEILLSKGVEKSPELRIALFNYVKKNPEFYALVTLNFSMFREIAESLEASAMKRLDKLIQATKNKTKTVQKKRFSTTSRADILIAQRESSSTSLSSMASSSTPTAAVSTTSNKLTKSISSSTIADTSVAQNHILDDDKNNSTKSANRTALYSEDSLNLCLVELVDAADCFVKAGCYKRSNQCENKARLTALQLALLQNNESINLFDLSQSELNDVILNFTTFCDAYIVVEAYNYHRVWRQALFKNVILNEDHVIAKQYLDEYSRKCDLSNALIMELVFLYKQHLSKIPLSSNSQEESERLAYSMKLVLNRLTNVELKCKIFTQLNFNDAKEELLAIPAVQAHLKDLKLA